MNEDAHSFSLSLFVSFISYIRDDDDNVKDAGCDDGARLHDERQVELDTA